MHIIQQTQIKSILTMRLVSYLSVHVYVCVYGVYMCVYGVYVCVCARVLRRELKKNAAKF